MKGWVESPTQPMQVASSAVVHVFSSGMQLGAALHAGGGVVVKGDGEDMVEVW